MSAAWETRPERGSAAGLRLLVGALSVFGPAAGRAVLPFITAWYLLTTPEARAASRQYLARVLGRPAGSSDVARHFHALSQSILDRVLMALNLVDGSAIAMEGTEHVRAALARGRGCLLMGAHLGGLEALGAAARTAPARVRPMMYRRNAGPLTALMDRLDCGFAADVIELGQTSAMIEAREAVERGEMVSLLADRAAGRGEGGPDEGAAAERGVRWVRAPFLGADAPFPAGPWALAHVLGAPVVLVRAVRLGRGRWLVQFEPFADRVTLRRGADRAADLRAYVGDYAAALERGCRAHPYQWFNFFPFWGRAADSPRALTRRRLALLAGTILWPSGARADALDIPELMARLAEVPERHATFRQEKRVAGLTEPLISTGRLLYRRPGHLEMVTLWPIQESLVADEERVTLTAGAGPPRVVRLDADPGLRPLVDAFRAPMMGDLAALARSFRISGRGTNAAWALDLEPLRPEVARFIRAARLVGAGTALREVSIVAGNGDEQRLAIEPAA